MTPASPREVWALALILAFAWLIVVLAVAGLAGLEKGTGLLLFAAGAAAILAGGGAVSRRLSRRRRSPPGRA